MFYLDLFSALARHQAGVTIDVLLFPPVDFPVLASHAVVLTVGNVPVHVASIDDLIALKQDGGRPIDLSDIEHLKRLKELGQ